MGKDELGEVLGRIDVWLLVFGIVVVVGVAGESFFVIRHWWNSRKLQAIQRAEALSLQAQISDASRRTAQSEAEVAGAKERAARAEKEAAEASAKAEGFRLDIAKANERAADANRIAEQERLARVKLEARLADRTITPEQQNAIRFQLATVSGIVMDVVIWGDTPEIQSISHSILDSIPRPEWTVHIGQAAGGSAVRGILIGTQAGADANIIRASALLFSALRSAGLACGLWQFEQLRLPSALFNTTVRGDAPLRMFIGAK